MSTSHSTEGLKRVVGVSGLALTIVNGVIGSGIFALPALISMALGGFGIVAYIVCSIMLASIMLCYAEIGSKISSSGGSYAYVDAAFGNYFSFIINCLYFFGWGILGSAAVMNILADSLTILFPTLSNSYFRAILFFVLIGFMVSMNVRGTKQGVGMVQLVTIIKLFPLLCIIVFGIAQIKAENLHWDKIPSIKSFGDTTLVLFYAFAGFETSLGVSGEFKNPKRTVPLGIFLGGTIILLVYMLLQMVTQGILGDQIVLYKDAPLAAVAEKLIGPIGATILLITATISCFGCVSADILATPRSLFAAANNGIFPKILGKVHPKFATPYWAIIVYGLSVFVFSISGGFKQLAVLASAAILLVYLAVILATIKMRNQQNESNEKTFKIPGGLLFPLIGIIAILWLISSLTQWEFISTTLFIACISIIYILTKWYKKLYN
ncbi:MAG: amino acid permease [Sediminibacterium sp.]|nr:amino acid permease [Sediminibacterium sp.]TXT33125.1 MAG: amino acid permease-associated region [Chitinophagaceae bacterium]